MSNRRDGIERLGDQHYRVFWRERGTGKERSKVIHGTREEAKRYRDAMNDSQTRGEYVTPDAMTVRQYLEGWLERRRLMGEVRESTHERYIEFSASICSRLGAVRLQDLSKRMIEDYYAWCLGHEVTRLGKLIGEDTVHKRHKMLKQALEDAVQEEPPLIPRNPAARAKHPSAGKPSGQAWTREEAQSILAAVHSSWVDLPVRIALHTGLRIGELMALRWRDLYLPAEGGGRLTVSGQLCETSSGFRIVPYAKTTHSRRTVAFGVELADALREHRRAQAEKRMSRRARIAQMMNRADADALAAAQASAWEDNDLVLAGEHGQLIRSTKVSQRFTPMVRLLEEQGVLATEGASFHSLRHTHATLLLRDKVPVHVVSRRLGHSRIQITLDYYAHAIPGDDEEVAETFDLLISRAYDEATNDISTTFEAKRETAEAVS